ncbi:imidazolonepropionase-like domain-containing protein [Streptomyces noursei]|uniref:imidazolonepropionase-like domain-containing protein n=1 Tax=Streptomyces noursei TaxID=1971 RepID=UPI00380E7E67
MLTLHRVRAVRLAPAEDPEGAEPLPGYAVVVDGDRLAAVGPYEELLAAYGDRARIREWDGTLTPGRHEPDGAALLEATYHPDPREAAELGTEPLTGAALAALPMTEVRWGASARRGLQRLLALGTTTLAGPFTHPAVRTAVQRSGIRQTPRTSRPSPARAGGAAEAAEAPSRSLAPGAPADFAVFAPDGSCLATVLAGRLVHRRR